MMTCLQVISQTPFSCGENANYYTFLHSIALRSTFQISTQAQSEKLIIV